MAYEEAGGAMAGLVNAAADSRPSRHFCARPEILAQFDHATRRQLLDLFARRKEGPIRSAAVHGCWDNAQEPPAADPTAETDIRVEAPAEELCRLLSGSSGGK